MGEVAIGTVYEMAKSAASAEAKMGKPALAQKKKILTQFFENQQNKCLVKDLVFPSDVVILVTPIDSISNPS